MGTNLLLLTVSGSKKKLFHVARNIQRVGSTVRYLVDTDFQVIFALINRTTTIV